MRCAVSPFFISGSATPNARSGPACSQDDKPSGQTGLPQQHSLLQGASSRAKRWHLAVWLYSAAEQTESAHMQCPESSEGSEAIAMGKPLWHLWHCGISYYSMSSVEQ